MQLLYNIGIVFFGLGIRVAALFNSKAKKWIEGRKNYFENLPKVPAGKKVIWFHCASLGEFDQGLPLMKSFKEKGDYFLLVSFYSPSGMEFHSKRDHHADAVVYLPLDTPSNARRFIHYFHPKKAFFIKYEFWANFIAEANRKHVEIYNVSGIFRSNQRFFKPFGGFFRKTLKKFKWFFVQNESSKKLLESIGLSNITVTGDSRFDRVVENKQKLDLNPILEMFSLNQNVFIAGSTWPEDEQLIIKHINSTDDLVIIAPHNIHENQVVQLIKMINRPVERYSEIIEFAKTETKVIVLDTIGHLANAYAHGNYAYVGGGFSGSLHNILEPAVFGLPVIFGPKHGKFPEANQFITAGFGFSVANEIQLQESIFIISSNIDDLKEKALGFVSFNTGSTKKIMEYFTTNSTL